MATVTVNRGMFALVFAGLPQPHSSRAHVMHSTRVSSQDPG